MTLVSHAIRSSSTSVAISIVVIDLVTEPTIISVSGVTGSEPPSSRTPNPRSWMTAPSWTTAIATPGIRIRSIVSAT